MPDKKKVCDDLIIINLQMLIFCIFRFESSNEKKTKCLNFKKSPNLSFCTFVRGCDRAKVDVLGILRDQLDKYSVILSSALITEYTYQSCR